MRGRRETLRRRRGCEREGAAQAHHLAAGGREAEERPGAGPTRRTSAERRAGAGRRGGPARARRRSAALGAGLGFKGPGAAGPALSPSPRLPPPGKMVCGGFACSRNALCALNVVYVLVGLLLIGVAAWGKSFGIVSSIHIIGGVIAVGVFLLLIAIVGLIGAINHHQVMLFFYMVILGLVFLFQLGVSCSCLALNTSRQERLFTAAWNILGNSTRKDIEVKLNCCGLLNNTSDALAMQTFQADYSACKAVCKVNMTRCPKCGEKMLKHSDEALKILGGVGLFFSFTEILGVLLAMRYRNQKDPRANPSAFL